MRFTTFWIIISIHALLMHIIWTRKVIIKLLSPLSLSRRVMLNSRRIRSPSMSIEVNCKPIRRLREPSKESRDFRFGSDRTVFNARSIYLNRMRSVYQSGAHNSNSRNCSNFRWSFRYINALRCFSQKASCSPSSFNE